MTSDGARQPKQQVPFLSLPCSPASQSLRAFFDEFQNLTEDEEVSGSQSPSQAVSVPLCRLLRSGHHDFEHLETTNPATLPVTTTTGPLGRSNQKKTKAHPSGLNLQGPSNKVSRLQGTSSSANSETSGEMGEDGIPGPSCSASNEMLGDDAGSQEVSNGTQMEFMAPTLVRVKMPRVSQRKIAVPRKPTPHIIFTSLKGKPCLYFYNSVTQKRKKLCEIPALRKFSSSVVAGDCLYMMGGILEAKSPKFGDRKAALDTVEIYNLDGKCQKRTGPVMLKKRKEAAAVVHGDFIHVTGGTNLHMLMEECEFLNWTIPAESAKWEKLPAYMKVHRSGHSLAILNDEMYAIGGVGRANTTLTSVEKYNFVTKTWSPVSPLKEDLARASVAVMDNKIYVVGGVTNRGEEAAGFERLKSVEVYDPSLNLWVKVAPMNKQRRDPVVLVDEGRLYAIGGDNGSATTEVYNPIKDQWHFISSESSPEYIGLMKNMYGIVFEGAIAAFL